MIYKNVCIIAKELKAVTPQEARILFFCGIRLLQLLYKLCSSLILTRFCFIFCPPGKYVFLISLKNLY